MTQEQLRMQILAGIITESQYKQLLEDVNTPEHAGEDKKEDSTPPSLQVIIDDYKSRKEELKNMGKEKNEYAQAFAKWAKSQIGNVNFADRVLLDSHLEKLLGMRKYSMYPSPEGKIKNFLPIETLEDWKSNNDPRYIGLLVYLGRLIDPEPRRY
jgi:hypothetical protein